MLMVQLVEAVEKAICVRTVNAVFEQKPNWLERMFGSTLETTVCCREEDDIQDEEPEMGLLTLVTEDETLPPVPLELLDTMPLVLEETMEGEEMLDTPEPVTGEEMLDTVERLREEGLLVPAAPLTAEELLETAELLMDEGLLDAAELLGGEVSDDEEAVSEDE
jgi:hypothetical protein